MDFIGKPLTAPEGCQNEWEAGGPGLDHGPDRESPRDLRIEKDSGGQQQSDLAQPLPCDECNDPFLSTSPA